MFNVRLAGGHLYGKQLFTWLSLVVSLMASFVLSFFPLDVLDEIWDLIESVSEGFLTYSPREHLNELWEFTKIVLILSHGQLSIERGFSTHNKIVVDNMAKLTLEAFRRVYDGLKQYQMDLADIPVSKKMLETCRGARTRYQQHLDE